MQVFKTNNSRIYIGYKTFMFTSFTEIINLEMINNFVIMLLILTFQFSLVPLIIFSFKDLTYKYYKSISSNKIVRYRLDSLFSFISLITLSSLFVLLFMTTFIYSSFPSDILNPTRGGKVNSRDGIVLFSGFCYIVAYAVLHVTSLLRSLNNYTMAEITVPKAKDPFSYILEKISDKMSEKIMLSMFFVTLLVPPLMMFFIGNLVSIIFSSELEMVGFIINLGLITMCLFCFGILFLWILHSYLSFYRMNQEFSEEDYIKEKNVTKINLYSLNLFLLIFLLLIIEFSLFPNLVQLNTELITKETIYFVIGILNAITILTLILTFKLYIVTGFIRACLESRRVYK